MTDQEKERAEHEGQLQKKEYEPAKEQPTYYRKGLERDDYSGRSWGGDNWNGRRR